MAVDSTATNQMDATWDGGDTHPSTAVDVSLKPTLYERVSSLLLALLVFVGIVVGLLGAIWLTNQVWGGPPPVRPVQILTELPGGDLEGDPTVDEDVIDPAVQEELIEVETTEQVVENVMNVLAEQAVVADPDAVTDPLATAEGPIGRRKFGHGPGTGGLPREERWIITYPPGQGLREYAQLLDSFGIELGVIAGGKLYIVSQLSASKPRVRQVPPEEEKRLYLTWRTGERKKADFELAKKAGIQNPVAVIQLIPPELEQELARLEQAYKGKKPDEIISTRFKLRRRGNKWEFYVASQVTAS